MIRVGSSKDIVDCTNYLLNAYGEKATSIGLKASRERIKDSLELCVSSTAHCLICSRDEDGEVNGVICAIVGSGWWHTGQQCYVVFSHADDKETWKEMFTVFVEWLRSRRGVKVAVLEQDICGNMFEGAEEFGFSLKTEGAVYIKRSVH